MRGSQLKIQMYSAD